MQIPKQVKIGGIRYKVKIVEPEDVEEKTGAIISAEKCWVKIVKGDPQFMHQAFLHEMFHAINMEFAEETVEFLAQALYQIVTDNPRLFREVRENG